MRTYTPPQSRPLSYAPTTHSFIPTYPNSTIPLDEEQKPYTSTSERDLIDSLAELYSIICTLDGLEKAYQKDALSEGEYSDMCNKMLKQYRSLLSDERVSNEFGTLDSFMARWELEAPRAAETLKTGLTRDEVYTASRPAYPPAGQGVMQPQQNQPSGSLILAATENFITFLDALRLNWVSKQQLHPILSDVIQSVNKVTDQDFDNRGKIIQWLITLNAMKAGQELSEEQTKECTFDMEAAYAGFKGVIS